MTIKEYVEVLANQVK